MVWEEVTDDEQGPSCDDSMLVSSSYRPSSKTKSPLHDRTNTTTTVNAVVDCEDGGANDGTTNLSSKKTIPDGVKDKKTSVAASKGGKKTATAAAAAAATVVSGVTGKQQQSMMSFFNKKA